MPHRFCVLILVLAAIVSSAASAQVYRYVDDNGRVVYASVKPPGIEKADKVNIRHNSVSSPAINDEVVAKDVVIYSATWCGICKRAKAYFEEQGVAYDEFDIEKDAKGKRDYARMRGRGVPIILVGDQRMDGFDQARFQRLYSAEN
ncbi:MAG: glutaredoxin family protein [Pseudomonadota bacterium]|nr:glutaredoxin family protein [Pseudomonadota bacterium]